MLLSFPCARAQLYRQHVGTTEIRQNIVRHTFVAGPETGAVEMIEHIDAQPTIPAPLDLENVARLFFPPPAISDVPTFRFLLHLRLGPSRSDAPDPLV
jgi:hypothetical protein